MSDLKQRIPEPELMDDQEQARAYARADFSEPHDHFVEQFKASFPRADARHALDLGCGPGDITRRFARAFPNAMLTPDRHSDRHCLPRTLPSLASLTF